LSQWAKITTPKSSLKVVHPMMSALEYGNLIALLEIKEDELIPLKDGVISLVCQDIHDRFPKIKKRLSRQNIAQKYHLQVPMEFEEKYIDIFFKHQDAIRINKYDLGLAEKLHTQNPP
jgi:hypothetical protein